MLVWPITPTKWRMEKEVSHKARATARLAVRDLSVLTGPNEGHDEVGP